MRGPLLVLVLLTVGCQAPTPCDLGRYPQSGCPAGAGCAVVPDERPSQDGREVYACVPDVPSELTECHLELAARDVAIEPLVLPDDHPTFHPYLDCHVEEPVRIPASLHGVALTGRAGPIGSCEAVHSLVDTVDDLSARGVVSMQIDDNTNCRVVSHTNNISSHAFGWAFDLSAFTLQDGTVYTVEDDWEKDTAEPVTEGGAFLYDAANAWFDNGYWKRIMTPDFNEAHASHFHVDRSPTEHWID